MAKEPKRLEKGKIYHKEVQSDWKENAEGIIKTEKNIVKPDGKIGRIDIHIKADNKLVAVVEIKNSNWDKMTIGAVKRNVKRQTKQVWDYINSQLEYKDISPGIIFPKKPKNPSRLNLIEKLFGKQSISVVWEDETIEKRKDRF